MRSGICGADGQVITSRRRSPEAVDYGFFGDPVRPVRPHPAVGHDCRRRNTPYAPPDTADPRAQLLNTNADTVARAVTSRLMVTAEGGCELIYCFEKNGVLYDVADEQSVIPAT